jgi:purine-nucleoside phosphorylase
MEEYLSLEQIDSAVAAVRAKTKQQPEIGMILGTGLGDLADAVEGADVIHYEDIPFMPSSTVQGHRGQLVIGSLGGKCVLVLQGRVHYYEGYSMSQVTLPIRIMQRLGVKALVVTNAAGAINPDFNPGDIMLITDHISFVGMAGPNPLRGPNIDELGTRFPDMSQAYDRAFNDLARRVTQEENISMREGVYAGLSGPSFETPADLRFLRVMGADAVGMSTVPEVIVARHAGIRVLGISGISNKANLDGSTITTHAEVLEAGKIIVPKMKTVVMGALPKMQL